MIEIIRQGEAKLKKILSRSQLEMGEQARAVHAILEDIKANGDGALFQYTQKYDKIKLDAETLTVSAAEIEEALEKADPALLNAMKKSAENIRKYHEKQLQKTWTYEEEGILLGQLVQPIGSLGIYVPGGAAAYPSSVLMSAIPARVAGVPRIAIATPCNRETGKIPVNTLAAAAIAGVDVIYKMGGAQAIGALAYGTAAVEKVDKIIGPGNIYVALAKREVFGYVGIDSIAGPSEVLVIADSSANPAFVAADLLSQAEHDPLAACICITADEMLAKEIADEVQKQTARLERESIIASSLRDFGAIIVTDTIEEAFALANKIAPEHLELCMEHARDFLPMVRNAGAVFLGHYSPEPLGDYFAGPSHVLPTSGTARFFSPLSVDDFIKKSSIIEYSKSALEKVHGDIELFAHAEGLTAHENSVKIRFEKENKK